MKVEGDAVRSEGDAVRSEGDAVRDRQGHRIGRTELLSLNIQSQPGSQPGSQPARPGNLPLPSHQERK